jgi:hypothetical protein
MQRYNNLTPLQRDNFVNVLTIFEVSSTGRFSVVQNISTVKRWCGVPAITQT